MVSTDAASGDSSLATQVREVATTPHFIAWTALAFMTTASVAMLCWYQIQPTSST
jgi:hypothetical protein